MYAELEKKKVNEENILENSGNIHACAVFLERGPHPYLFFMTWNIILFFFSFVRGEWLIQLQHDDLLICQSSENEGMIRRSAKVQLLKPFTVILLSKVLIFTVKLYVII